MKKINQQLDLVNAYHMTRQSLRSDNLNARVPYWFALALRTMISVDEKGATFFIREIVNRDNIASWLTSHTTEELRDASNSFPYRESPNPRMAFAIMDSLDIALGRDGRVESDCGIKDAKKIKESILAMKNKDKK